MTTLPFDPDRAAAIASAALLRDLPDQVDLIFAYGSAHRGDMHRYSDLDLAYIPREPDTWHAITVLVDGILMDLFAIHWSRLEEMARFESEFNTILHESDILYARDDAARARFLALRDTLRANQAPQARPQMAARARDIFQRAAYPFFLLQEAAAAGHTLAALQQAEAVLNRNVQALAALNQAVIDTRKRDQVLALPLRPPTLAAAWDTIQNSTDPAALLDAAQTLLVEMRALLLADQQEQAQPARPLRATLEKGYPELRGDIDHLILACESDRPALHNFVSLHHELMIHMAWALEGIDYGSFNSVADYEQDLAALGFPALLPHLQAGDYPALAAAARQFDQRLQAYLRANDVPLHSYPDLDALAAALAAPNP